ncbi:MAG: HD-GYP domain-containing protein [Frankiaceae bacterium]
MRRHGRSGPSRVAPLRPVVILGMALGVTSVIVTAADGLTHRGLVVALSFGVLIFLGELVRVVLPGDRETAPVAVACALGYALTFSDGNPFHPMPLTVVAVATLASAAGAFVHGAVGRPMGVESLAHRILALAAAAVLFHAYEGAGRPSTPKSSMLVVVMIAITVVAGGLTIVFAAVERVIRHGTPLLAALGDETRAVAALGAAIGATGILIALSAPLMRLWALPVLSLPLLVAQFSMRRYSGIRATYRQTIRALAKVTEVGGYVAQGHSRRVAALAVATGREVGMTESELLDLEYAALMHDIGQLSLAEPIPGGSTLAVPPVERRRIAELGAAVIRSTGALDRVALIVERQADPYRRNRSPADPTLPLESRIIKAASAYDDVVAASPDDPRARADAIERLRLGMAYEYDPRVVDALARVVARLPYGVAPALSA